MAPEVALAADEGEPLMAARPSRKVSFDDPRQTEAYLEGKARASSGQTRRAATPRVPVAPRRAPAPAAEPSAPKTPKAPSARTQQSAGGFKAPSLPSLPSVNAVATPSGRSGIVMRLIVALGVALVALEAASYVSGQYFSWDLKSGATRIHDAGTMIGLYPGQQAKIQAAVSAAKTAPTPTTNSYASHGAVVM